MSLYHLDDFRVFDKYVLLIQLNGPSPLHHDSASTMTPVFDALLAALSVPHPLHHSGPQLPFSLYSVPYLQYASFQQDPGSHHPTLFQIQDPRLGK